MQTNSNKPPASPLLERRDAAVYVGLGLRTFNSHVKDGLIVEVRLSARRVGYLIADLDTFLQSRRVQRAG